LRILKLILYPRRSVDIAISTAEKWSKSDSAPSQERSRVIKTLSLLFRWIGRATNKMKNKHPTEIHYLISFS
jgi:hypothetical protein